MLAFKPLSSNLGDTVPKSYYLDNVVINSALRGIVYTPPVAVWCALFLVSPTPAGGGTEVAGGGYGRQTVTFGAPTNGVSTNATAVLFPTATLAWGTITAFGLYDASSGGNLLYFANLSSARSVLVNDAVRFPAGQLQSTEQ